MISVARSWHAFMEAVRLCEGEAALIYCNCPAVDGFLVVERVGDGVRLLYRPR